MQHQGVDFGKVEDISDWYIVVYISEWGVATCSSIWLLLYGVCTYGM